MKHLKDILRCWMQDMCWEELRCTWNANCGVREMKAIANAQQKRYERMPSRE